MLKTISLFSGFGGLDFGFEEAGFRTCIALEIDRHACRGMRLNRPSWKIIEDDINRVPSDVLLALAGLKPGQVDILIGGPPCQPFSKSSYWVRGDALRLDDPRADTLTGYLRILRDARPRVFLLENVYGLAYQGKDEGLRYILDGIAQINRQTGTNYEVSWQVINAAQYGVPQIRERVFMVGSAMVAASTSPNQRTLSSRTFRPIYSMSSSPITQPGMHSAICPSPLTKSQVSRLVANGATFFRASPRAKTTSGTQTAEAGSLFSDGAHVTGASFLNSRSTFLHGRFRRNPELRSVHSIGTIAASLSMSFADFRLFPMV